MEQPSAVREVKETKKPRKRKSKQRIEPNFEPGHGEKIWIFSNFVNGMTVYSHSPVLKVRRTASCALDPSYQDNDLYRSGRLIRVS